MLIKVLESKQIERNNIYSLKVDFINKTKRGLLNKYKSKKKYLWFVGNTSWNICFVRKFSNCVSSKIIGKETKFTSTLYFQS